MGPWAKLWRFLFRWSLLGSGVVTVGILSASTVATGSVIEGLLFGTLAAGEVLMVVGGICAVVLAVARLVLRGIAHERRVWGSAGRP